MLALASSEADAGPSLAWVGTRARREAGGWILDGRKIAVAALPLAEAVVVSARTAGEPGSRDGIGLFVVPTRANGVTVTPYRRFDGVAAGDLALDGVRIDEAGLLGDPAGGLAALERAVDLATVAACADALGAMTAVLQKTAAYLATRRQFDAPLASFQVLQHRLVDLYGAVEASRSMVIYAALHAGAPAAERARAASAAKTAVGERARFVGQQGVQLHGGVGMTEELDIGHYFRRLTLFQQAYGGADFHLQRFAALREAAEAS